jgi:hypothetical protein
MSGCGRKHRAKHLTREYLDDDSWSGPQGNEEVALSLESPHGKHLHVYIVPVPTSSGSDSELSEVVKNLTAKVVYLPGKFQKVIWIGVKDVIVVLDGAVHRKPSPAQLAIFFESSPAWKQTIQEVTQRVAAERPGASSELVPAPAEIPAAAVTDVEGDVDELDLMNPNRNNIRHHQAYFDEEEEDDDDDEDEEAEEGEDEEVEQ